MLGSIQSVLNIVGNKANLCVEALDHVLLADAAATEDIVDVE